MEIKLHSFFVLSLPSHLLENFFTTIFNFNEFMFVYVVNVVFICDGEIYLVSYFQASYFSGILQISRIAELQHWIFFNFSDIRLIFLEESGVISLFPE